MKGLIVLVSFWLLFIIAPAVLVFWLVRDMRLGFVIGIIALFVLLIAGEHGFRVWKRWWKVE